MHDLSAFPLNIIVQAPQCPVSQPMCVPVRFRSSLKKWTRSVLGSAIPVYSLPFILQVTCNIPVLSACSAISHHTLVRASFTVLLINTLIISNLYSRLPCMSEGGSAP